MYSFLIATVKNYHKIEGLKTTELYYIKVLEVRRPKLVSVLKPRYRSSSIPSGGLRGEAISLSLQLLKDPAPFGSWLHIIQLLLLLSCLFP